LDLAGRALRRTGPFPQSDRRRRQFFQGRRTARSDPIFKAAQLPISLESLYKLEVGPGPACAFTGPRKDLMGHHFRKSAQRSAAWGPCLLAVVSLCGCNLAGPLAPAPDNSSLGPLYSAVSSGDRLPVRPGGSLESAFSFRSIDGPGASATSATGINLRGQVVG